VPTTNAVGNMPTCFYDRHKLCIVFVCGERAIDDRDWDAYLAFVSGALKKDLQNRSLVLAKGSLTSLQRKKLARVVEPYEKTLKSAIVTESAIVRGIVTALQWFHRDVFRTFAPSDLDRALEFLDLLDRDRAHVKELALTLQKKLAEADASAA
jgi:hypothetical protein